MSDEPQDTRDPVILTVNNSSNKLTGYQVLFPKIPGEDECRMVMVSSGHELDMLMKGWLLGVRVNYNWQATK